MKLENQIEFFRKIQKRLAREHHGELVLIHGERVIGFFNSDSEAYGAAIKNGFEDGDFLVRQCLNPEEEIPLTFHSRVG